MTEYIDNILAKHNISIGNFISTIDELPLWSAPFGMMILEKMPYNKNMHVLDIGFGTGFPLLEIAQRLGASSKLFGIDPWHEAIGRAAKKCSVYDIHNVSLITGNAEEMPFENMTFDLIVSNNGLNNVQNIDKVLTSCYRVMKSGAELIFTVNLPGTMQEFYLVFDEILKANGMMESVSLLHNHIAEKRKTEIEWKQLLLTHNFKIQDVEIKEFNIKYTDGSAMFQHHFIKLAFLESWKEILPVGQVESILKEIKNKLNKIAEEKGVLSLNIPCACFICRKQ